MMTADRLDFAIRQGLALPEGPIGWIGASASISFPADRLEVLQGFAPDAAALAARGYRIVETLGDCAAVIVTLPRARDRAEQYLAMAAKAAPGCVILDGAKTDGIEALAKAVKLRVPLEGVVSKAHGKCLWFAPGDALADWARPEMSQNAEGDWVAPGVFSADGADPASKALAEALPPLKGTVADLGAGWGWLSARALTDAVQSLHLVEADAASLACARRNVDDRRARFHWADATTWKAPEPIDTVIMNPPFHSGRKGDPKLGQAFIAAAARALTPRGALWMVANRHLPYEATLAEKFGEVSEVAGNNKFKVLHAARPVRRKRG